MNIRIEKDLKMILLQKDNYSEWCREAFYEKLQSENDTSLLDKQIKDHKESINQLEQLKKQVKKDIESNGHKIKECLDVWYTVYRDKRNSIDDHFNISWIKDKILPNLKKLGCTQFSAKDILKIYVEHDQKGELLINV